MILMTKIDEVDRMVSKDLKNVYLSIEVRDAMEELSRRTGVPMSYITPIKNYEKETELEPAVDISTLTSLRQMLRLADDCFEDIMEIVQRVEIADPLHTLAIEEEVSGQRDASKDKHPALL